MPMIVTAMPPDSAAARDTGVPVIDAGITGSSEVTTRRSEPRNVADLAAAVSSTVRITDPAITLTPTARSTAPVTRACTGASAPRRRQPSSDAAPRLRPPWRARLYHHESGR